ncbi:MAG: hypothetical protein ABJW77_08415 [Gilvibacter sp.]
MFTQDFLELLASSIFLIFCYLAFFRKILRAQSLTFDENYFYTKKGDKIGYDKITEIVDGKITLIKKGVEKEIYVSLYFLGKNHKLFDKYYNLKKSN